MTHRGTGALAVGLMVAGAAILATGAPTARGDTFDVTHHTIDGGGGTSSDGLEFELWGTVGQPDAATSTDGSWTVSGGFWMATEAVTTDVFADGFENGDTTQWSSSVPPTSPPNPASGGN